ncbi:MAG TPA: DNA mismatch repair protein MutT [Firmicutes bacterium]|jgi:8-oxo-dGTP diphosphatase|nr:DNA mismatch repair protein MutT [Bacillota bacterium]HBE06523.1 DNA mismatch repair protein MutT [Bacillota bacterium]HBL51400.1 DNA mismatch repair protein MutT [Bacillota bacterium]HBL67567.1 DNA mismatch repair protein MutT [Bacillota bacterium]HCF93000.1 DNA mismatch repair protein MutT [Bacillota bacterium]
MNNVPKTELTTMVMIQNPQSGELLVQNRKRKWPGVSFPGGKVEPCESFYDCAVREIKEETGLDIRNLQYCGVVHWVERETANRYLCFLYKTSDYSGELITDAAEGEHSWRSLDELRAMPKAALASAEYTLLPLFHEFGKYSEAFIPWSNDESDWERYYK